MRAHYLVACLHARMLVACARRSREANSHRALGTGPRLHVIKGSLIKSCPQITHLPSHDSAGGPEHAYTHTHMHTQTCTHTSAVYTGGVFSLFTFTRSYAHVPSFKQQRLDISFRASLFVTRCRSPCGLGCLRSLNQLSLLHTLLVSNFRPRDSRRSLPALPTDRLGPPANPGRRLVAGVYMWCYGTLFVCADPLPEVNGSLCLGKDAQRFRI